MKIASNLVLQNRLGQRRFLRSVKREKRKKKLRRSRHEQYLEVKEFFNKEFEATELTYEQLIIKWMPQNLLFLIFSENSELYIEKLPKAKPKNGGILKLPKEFSLVTKPKESYFFLQQLTSLLVLQPYKQVQLDYADSEIVDLGAQVFLDIIIKDAITFYNRCNRFQKTKPYVESINGINVRNSNIERLLFSVGSPAIHAKVRKHYDDIVGYPLCVHNRDADGNPIRIREQKDLDTTNLVDYVLECLDRLNRKLSPEKLDNLSTVIGEILINAEEHSTTKHRFSIGYFHDIKENGKHYGVFRLTILNFGKTIYEKFKDPECKNVAIVGKMAALSANYTKRNFFSKREFEEETLWTLYALQEGVTSIPQDRYIKRGNGSIQFIDSFFNLKGDGNEHDNFSKLTILSGNTNITFDGKYKISNGEVDGEPYRFMTFNESGDLEDKPSQEYVKFVDNYFPGTIIDAKIIFSDLS